MGWLVSRKTKRRQDLTTHYFSSQKHHEYNDLYFTATFFHHLEQADKFTRRCMLWHWLCLMDVLSYVTCPQRESICNSNWHHDWLRHMLHCWIAFMLMSKVVQMIPWKSAVKRSQGILWVHYLNITFAAPFNVTIVHLHGRKWQSLCVRLIKLQWINGPTL